LLIRALVELEKTSYVAERAGSQSIPVFYSNKAASFLILSSFLEAMVSSA